MSSKINDKNLLFVCGILGILAVGLGAFGAHGLKSQLPADKITTYTTGITYHFYHTISLLFVVILIKLSPSVWFKRAAFCFILGIILFSGSLYLLATRELIGITQYKWLGPLTPIGGVFFILGWLSLSIGALSLKDANAAN